MKTEQLAQIKKSAKEKYLILKSYGENPGKIYLDYKVKLGHHRDYLINHSNKMDLLKIQKWEKEFLAINTIINLASNEM